MSSAAILPQHMPFAQFANAAQVNTLYQHGRDWEIFFNGVSLGFADGTREVALAQVHKREVNNALYANLPDAPEWLKAEMPSIAVLAEYPQVVSRFPDVLANHSKF